MLEIVKEVNEYKRRARRVYPCTVNRASSIGMPCLRYLVYCRTHWESQALPSLGLQYIFDEGNMHEDAVLDVLRKSGMQVTEQQRSFELRGYNVTGHIDGKIIDDGMAIPLEIKSSEPYSWSKMDTPQDMINTNKIWWRKYPSQMQTYIAGCYGIEGDKPGNIKCKVSDARGIMITKNKLNGWLKQIEFTNNDEFLNDILNKALIINKHVDEGTLPDPIEPDEDTCGRCSFKTICIPDVDFGETLAMVDNEYLFGLLTERQSLIQVFKRYNVIDKEVKNAIKGWGNRLLGQFHLSGKWINKKAFTVSESRYWKSNVKFLGEVNNED